MTDRYETLLSAVRALDPFDECFMFVYTGNDEVCAKCGWSEIHPPECPVTHLRNILAEDEKPSEKSDMYKEWIDTFRESMAAEWVESPTAISHTPEGSDALSAAYLENIKRGRRSL